MIGAIVYRLRAINAACMPVVHGKLLHGLLFRRLQQFSPELSGFVHDELNIKPFTTSPLRWLGKAPFKRGGNYYVARGSVCLWRVTALHELLIQALLTWEARSELRVGTAQFIVEKVMANPDDAEESGLLDENELIASCLCVPKIRYITLHFISPVSFRSFKDDFPLPKPELIFGSIADKWNQAEMPLNFDKEDIRQIAMQCKLIRWEGKSCKTFFSQKQGVNGFCGTFVFDLSELELPSRQVLLLLAQFSVFSGVGRLTGQGMGQTRVVYS